MTDTQTTNKTEIRQEGDRELVVTRTFEAPRPLVFKAWTDPELVKQWWGPGTWPVVFCTIDLRVGGRWHYCLRGPEGDESWGAAIYNEIDAPKRLVVEDHFSDAEGTLKPPPMIMAVDFRELPGDRTTVVGRSTFSSKEHRDEVIAMGMAEGIAETLNQLADLLARQTGRAS